MPKNLKPEPGWPDVLAPLNNEEANEASLGSPFSALTARTEYLKAGSVVMLTGSQAIPLPPVSNMRELPDGGTDGIQGWGSTVRVVDTEGQPIPNGLARIGYIAVVRGEVTA